MASDKHTLGRLQTVDLREIWETEAGDFTPWLAGEENLKLLGDTIGIELELEAQEKAVGPFRADILCRDTANGNWVLIENQLARTDHTHLGQLLTYAAGLKAVTIVWIAERFTDEHRASLDWLNGITNDQFNFFGLEIEAWRIGDSSTAPKLNVVCKPNDWSKSVRPPGSKNGITETKALQQRYWANLRQLMIDRRNAVKPQKPQPQHWTNFALGRTYFSLVAAMNTQKHDVWVGVVCSGPDGNDHFHLLAQDRGEIESQMGCGLQWNALPGKKESRIEIHLPQSDPTDEAQWPKQHEWISDQLEAMYGAFSQRVKTLNAADFEPGSDLTA